MIHSWIRTNKKKHLYNICRLLSLEIGNKKDQNPVVEIHALIEKDLRILMPHVPNAKKTKFLFPLSGTVTLQSLISELHRGIPALKPPYNLQYRLPVEEIMPRPLNSDKDLVDALHQYSKTGPDTYFQVVISRSPHITSSTCNGPLLSKHIKDMPNPAHTTHYTMVSFYSFQTISDPEDTIRQLYEVWTPFKPLGRIYVAVEGINAQMAIPSNVVTFFASLCADLPLLSGVTLNMDSVQLSTDDFFRTKPFKALHIRRRTQIVVDGFDKPLNWTDAGTELAADEWDKAIHDPNALVFDCRNGYESDIGIFDNAVPLNTVRFQDSWEVLRRALEGKDKDTPVVTYCTGGIRCVKINAFLKQTLGFNNTFRLKGGIVTYARDVETRQVHQTQIITNPPAPSEATSFSCTEEAPMKLIQRPGLHSTSSFRGVNYVFDDRMGSRVTDDVLACCEMCGSICDTFHNCRNETCSVRFLQCPNCAFTYSGCCSLACQLDYSDSLRKKNNRERRDEKNDRSKVIARNNKPKKRKSFGSSSNATKSGYKSVASYSSSLDNHIRQQKRQFCTSFQYSPTSKDMAVDMYCSSMTQTESDLLSELRVETYSRFPLATPMLCSHVQGRLLALLSSLHKPKHVLELGTFTGYSAICMAEGLSTNGRWYDGTGIVTVESDRVAAATAKTFFDRHEEEKQTHEIFDLRVNKASAELSILQREDDILFDMVFLDADKKSYISYLRVLMGESSGIDGDYAKPRNMLADGALIVTDNTLWKGLVLKEVDDLASFAPSAESIMSRCDSKTEISSEKRGKHAHRMQEIASDLHKFNSFCKNHTSLSPVMLPIRDGLTLCKYNY